MTTTTTFTEYGAYRDRSGNTWRGYARPQRFMEAITVTTATLGEWRVFDEVVADHGALTAIPCKRRVTGGGTCVRPWHHTTVCRSRILVGAPGMMTVRVRDRSAEVRWSIDRRRTAVRTVTISATCPKCGGARGAARESQQTTTYGIAYTVDFWSNVCGHADAVADVLDEARRLGPLEHPVYY